MRLRKTLLITLLFALISAMDFSTARAEVHAKLQWFDQRNEVMDLDWATNIQWVWNQDKSPAAQLIITVPAQLNLVTVDDSQAKFSNSVPDAEGKITNRTLVVEMNGPRKTIQLKKIEKSANQPANPQADQNDAAKEIGLTIILVTDAPNIIPSESCDQEGITVEPRQADANFLFLAATCKNTQAGLRIALQTSNDALIARDEDELAKAHSGSDPLVLLIPKKTIDATKTDALIDTVRVESQARPPMVTQFELISSKENQELEKSLPEAAHITNIKRAPEQHVEGITIPASAPAPKDAWRLAAGLSFNYVAYTQLPMSAGNDPSELNLLANFSAEHAVLASSTHFKSSAEIPIVALAPHVRMLASGIYQASARASFTILDHGKFLFHLEPGLEIDQAYFDARSDASGFYYGPVIGAHLSDEISAFGNRKLSALLTAAPLSGHDAAPFLQNWNFSFQLALEMLKPESERKWDLVMRLRALTLHSTSFPATRATETSLGVRTSI